MNDVESSCPIPLITTSSPQFGFLLVHEINSSGCESISQFLENFFHDYKFIKIESVINRLDKTPNIIAKFPQNCFVVIKKKLSPENAFLDILSEGAMVPGPY